MKSKSPGLYHPGEIVLVRFPFSDLESSKKRPALCLSSHRLTDKIQIVVVAMVTSKVENFALDGDYLLSDWKDAGLLHPSLVRLSKVASLDLILIEKKLGKITEQDSGKIASHFKRIFSHWL